MPAARTTSTLVAIPWTHSTFDLGSVWKWATPHFVITVNGDDRSCYWQLSDMSSGKARPFADGRAATFPEAEEQLRETVGKAYDPKLGYQPFAGALATTFMTSTGQRIDFGPYSGQHVIVTYVDGDGTSTCEGVARIDHFDLLIAQGKKATRISPTYIVAIKAVGLHKFRNTGKFSRRTFDAHVELGCDGTPGDLPNTVDHTGAECPIHEYSTML